MRLRTIWTIPVMSTSERLRRTRDWGAMGIARHLPLRIRYWATVQEMAKATIDSPNIPATTLDTIMQNLEAPQ